jgi:predicted transcriptional regulator
MKLGEHASPELKAKLSEAARIRNLSPEYHAKLSAAATGKRGRVTTPETRTKLSMAGMGHIVTPETRAKLSVAEKGKPKPPLSLEARAKISIGNKGKIRSPEARTNMSISAKKRGISPETRGKMRTSLTGRSLSPEHRVNIGLGHWKGGRSVTIRKFHARRRLLGFVALNELFPGAEAHHVDNEQIIYLPHDLHRSIYHRQTDGYGMAKINAVAYNFLFKQEVEAAMGVRNAAE